MLKVLKAKYALLFSLLKWRMVLSVVLLCTVMPVTMADSEKLFTFSTRIIKESAVDPVHSEDSASTFSNSSEEVLQFLLNTANSSMQSSLMSTSLQPSDSLLYKLKDKKQEDSQLNSERARSELLRILRSQVIVKEDLATHEKIQTIPEAKFRNALDKVLKRKFVESTSSFPTQNPSASNIDPPTTRPSPALSSQLVCQFFVFGTLFGVVCSISTCTWCLKPNSEGSSSPTSEVNPTNVPAPIDYSKPYMIKCDSRGSCYASPLDDDEVPPLPSYDDALECPREPTSSSSHLRFKDSNDSISTP